MEEKAIVVQNLVKQYPKVKAVDDVSFTVDKGEIFGLLGPNGAGKTTTVEILEGLLPATSGEVELLGRTWQSDADWLRQRLGISLQETNLSDKLTVEETLRLFRSFGRSMPPARKWKACLSWSHLPTNARRGIQNCPAAKSSGWRSPARWSETPKFCFWMSPPAGSTRSPGDNFGA